MLHTLKIHILHTFKIHILHKLKIPMLHALKLHTFKNIYNYIHLKCMFFNHFIKKGKN